MAATSKKKIERPRTDLTRWRLTINEGTHRWFYLSKQDSEEQPQSFAEKHFLGLLQVRRMHRSIITGNPRHSLQSAGNSNASEARNIQRLSNQRTFVLPAPTTRRWPLGLRIRGTQFPYAWSGVCHVHHPHTYPGGVEDRDDCLHCPSRERGWRLGDASRGRHNGLCNCAVLCDVEDPWCRGVGSSGGKGS